MLVQADTGEDLQAIANLSGGLPIMPESAADIATALGVSHYPVLVSSQGISQFGDTGVPVVQSAGFG